jgi:hypothetical protein
MKDFDQEYTASVMVDGKPTDVRVSRVERAAIPAEDRTFVIGGESFVYRSSVAPESFKKWSMMIGGEYVVKDERGRPMLDADKQPISTLTENEALAIYDDTVLAFLEPGQEEKWAKVRSADAANPLNLGDIKALMSWLFEVQSSRPIGRSNGSSPGSETTEPGTSSTAASSSPEETA